MVIGLLHKSMEKESHHWPPVFVWTNRIRHHMSISIFIYLLCRWISCILTHTRQLYNMFQYIFIQGYGNRLILCVVCGLNLKNETVAYENDFLNLKQLAHRRQKHINIDTKMLHAYRFYYLNEVTTYASFHRPIDRLQSPQTKSSSHNFYECVYLIWCLRSNFADEENVYIHGWRPMHGDDFREIITDSHTIIILNECFVFSFTPHTVSIL